MIKKIIASTLLLSSLSSYAEDLNDIFKRVNEFVDQRNYSKALEELAWARKEIEKLNTGQVSSYFPETLAGLRGEKFETSSALGFNSAERTYRGDGAEVKVVLTGASGGGNQGMGALMGLGKMAAMMDIPGQETIRVQGRTATLNTENESYPKLSVYLDSGSVLSIEGQNGATAELLKKMVGELKIEELDKYLKG